MPSVREALLDSAHPALSTRPRPAVRMAEVAARAGVSRQALRHGPGGKDGPAHAPDRCAADDHPAGVHRHSVPTAPEGGLLEPVRRTVRAARADAPVTALFTGVRDECSPGPGPPGGTAPLAPTEPPAPVGDRAVTVLKGGSAPCGPVEPAMACEVALRLVLSYALVPAECAGPSRGLSAPNRTAADRSHR